MLHSVLLHRDLGVGRGSLPCFTPFCFIAIWGGEGIASLLHSVLLHRDLGVGRGSLPCFTPFRFIAIWGGEGIASLLHSVPLHRDLGWGGDRFIASLRSASSRFGVGRGSLHCFTPFRFIVIWGGEGIASLLHSVPLHRDLGWGGDRFIASLRSASSRFGGGEGIT